MKKKFARAGQRANVYIKDEKSASLKTSKLSYVTYSTLAYA